MLAKKDLMSEKHTIKVECLLDMMGRKPSCCVTDGMVSPTLTRGRGTVNDVHIVLYHLERKSRDGIE